MMKLAGWGRVGLLVLVLAVVAAAAWAAPTSEEAPTPSLSAAALAYWVHADGGAWLVPVLLDELEYDIRQLDVPPEQAVAAAARHFSLDPKQAAALVEAEVRAAALLDPEYAVASDPEEVAELVEDAVSAVGDQLNRWRLLIRFYGSLARHSDEPNAALGSRGLNVVSEAFDAGFIEEIWDIVEGSGLPEDDTFGWLLARAPDHPWLLRKLADSTWDCLERAAIRLHLARSEATRGEATRGEATRGEAVRELLSLGASRSAVELWQSEDDPPDLSDDLDVRSESLPESMAAALWLEGHSEEATELLATLTPVEVGTAPKREDYGGEHRVFYYESEKWSERSARMLRRQVVREGLRPSGLDPYELALEILRVRDPEARPAVLQEPLWGQAGARWAQAAGHEALERYFLVNSLGMLGYQPTHRAHGRLLDWPRALADGAISASLYELRESLFQEIQRTRDAAEARIDALAHASAGNFPPQPVAASGHEEVERVASPFEVRQLGDAASRAWIELGKLSEEDARDILDSGEVPLTLPVAGEQVVAFGRDGSIWWALHRGRDVDGGNVSAWLGLAYWLSLSHDGGHSWTPPLHTGLMPGSPLLLLDKGSELVRGELTLRGQMLPWDESGFFRALPMGESPVVFELRVDIEELRLDEDGDGWTDVLERGLATDPESEDTDGDGIADVDDPLPRQVGAAGAESEALAVALVDLFDLGEARAGDGAEDRGPIRFFGPQLPLPVIDGRPIVQVPEELALDERFGGRYDPRVRLWMVNREVTRAFLSWTGPGYGAMEFVRASSGWIFYTGYHGGGCLVTHEQPSDEAKAAAAEL